MTTVNSNKPLTTVKNAAKPAVAKTVSVASATPAAPRTPSPTKTKLSALAQMQADKPKFGNPDEYKNYVIKFSGYIRDAKDEHEVANRALEAEKQKESDASAEYSKPLNAAKKVYEDTHNLYQGTIDKTSRELNAAKQDLDNAIYPGKAKAAELDREAEALANQISRIDGDIRSARSRISSLESGINQELNRRSSAESSRSAAESEIRRLEPQAPSDSALSSQRTRVNDAASRLSSANSRLSEANSKLNRYRELQRAVDTLSSIDSQYDSAVDSRSSLKGWVGRRQNELDAATASGDAAKIQAAKSAYDEALQKYNAAEQKVRSFESQMSSYGASPSTINSVISSKKSELSSLSGAQSEYDSASSAKSSAQQTYNSEKSRLDTMENIADELDRNYEKKNTAIRTINEANARISAYTGEKSQLNTSIYQLQDQLDTKTRQRTNVVAEANRERARQNPADHPQVVAAKRRVDDLTGDLKHAQDTYNEKIRAPKAKVDEEQTKYNHNMAPYRAKVADAQRTVTEKAAAIETVKKEFDALKDIGFFKKIWWKLRYHFDVEKFWKEQGSAVALDINQQAKTANA
jgi:chromosome segregation ATPase